MNNYEYYGPEKLLLSVKAVILNSRQSKYPVGNDSWVKNSTKASEYIDRNGYALIASIGMNSWELSLALASINKIPVIIVLWYQPRDMPRFIAETCVRFNLNAERVGIVVPQSYGSPPDRKFWPERDRLAVDLADLILPVSIRSGGGLKKLIDSRASKVDSRFLTSYDRTRRKRPEYKIRKINPELVSGRWLIHFTRSNSSCWPGQSETEYYRSVIDSGDNYCHSALEALYNISSQSILHGSGSNLRKGNRSIGFTDCAKIDLDKFFRYRPRLVNPGFEPYGIALDKNYAKTIGMRPVIYGDENLYRRLAKRDRPFFQNVGGVSRAWESESEWRLEGDLNLDLIPDGVVAQVVPDPSVVEKTKSRGSVPVWPLVVE